MPWITRNGRPQFVGDWGSLSDGERWQAIHNRNASSERTNSWPERQVTSYSSSEATKRLRLDNYGYFALKKHSDWNFILEIESKDLQIVYALKLTKDQIFALIDKIEQEVVGPPQELHPKEIKINLEKDRDSYLLNVELESVSALLPFKNMSDVTHFQSELKNISSWTRDDSSLVPQRVLDYLSQNSDNGIADEALTFVKNEYSREKLAGLGNYDFPSLLSAFWSKKGLDRKDFTRYPEEVSKRIDSAEALANQGFTKLAFLCKLELFESLIVDGTKYAEELGRPSIRLRDIDELLAKRDLRLNTKLKSLLYAVVNNRLLATQ